MKERFIKICDFFIYWSIIMIPFATAISNGMMNSFMGMLIGFFILKRVIKKKPLFLKTEVNLPFLLLFIITCLSLIHSVDIKDTVKGGILRLLQYILVFFAVLQETKDKKHIILILISAIAGLSLASIDSIWQVITGKDFIRGYLPILNLDLVRATASFKDANVLGTYLSALAPLLIGFALYYFKGTKKWLFFILTLLTLLGILLTYSRPTLLAAYITFLSFALIRKDKLTIILLVIFAVIAPFILPQSVKNWAKEVEYNPVRFMCNDDRIAIYQNTLNMIKVHPVLGLGANTFMDNYGKYKNKPEYRGIVTANALYAHNNFLHMAAEIGLLGLGIFFWFLYGLFKQATGNYQNQKEGFMKVATLSAIVCLIAFLVNGFTESSLYSSRVAILFWYLAGFSLVNREK